MATRTFDVVIHRGTTQPRIQGRATVPAEVPADMASNGYYWSARTRAIFTVGQRAGLSTDDLLDLDAIAVEVR